MRRQLFSLACACLLGLNACADNNSIPVLRSSSDLAMDGSHAVPMSGAPDYITQTATIDSGSGRSWSTPPVALPAPLGFAVATRDGKIVIFNDRDSLQSIIDLASSVPVDQLLVDENSIYAITLDGALYAYSQQGQQRWKSAIGGMMSTPAVLLSGLLVTAEAGNCVARATSDGHVLWRFTSAMSIGSLVVRQEDRTLVAALTGGVTTSGDSIVIIDHSGSARSRAGFPGVRITSNLTLCGESHSLVSFGGLTKGAADQRRPAFVALCAPGGSASWKELWRRSIPYLVVSTSANDNMVFANGFRTLESEMVSGIDGMGIEDTSYHWSRRFTEPVAAPLAVSKGSIYFGLTVSTEAIVATKGLFYTLEAGTGETKSERPLRGASSGILAGMPTPDEKGRLLIADRDKLTVYILDRTALRRLF